MNGKESHTEQTLAKHSVPMSVCAFGGCVMEHILLDVRTVNEEGELTPGLWSQQAF